MWPTQQVPQSPLAQSIPGSFPFHHPFPHCLSSFKNEVHVLPQQCQEQNLGETLWNLLVWGAHPLRC